MSVVGRLSAAAVLALLLTGCGGDPSPQQQLAERVDAATAAANARDAEGLREAALALADTVAAQREADLLDDGRAEELTALATSLRTGADVIDPAVQARRAAEQQAAREAEEAAAARAAQEQADQDAAEQRRRESAAAAEDDGDDDKGKGKGRDRDKDDD